ncbi:MAG: M23 family metallopeptidase [Calditrichaeota bacterium]|nr:M23 family metallopeptidase [Calditrichota bacterium]
MNKSHGIKLALISEGSSRMRVFGFSRFKVIVLSFFLIALLSLVTYSAGRIIAHHYVKRAMSDVLQENRDLRVNLDNIGERLVEIDSNLEQLTVIDDQMRIQADIPRIDNEMREVGIGGALFTSIGLDDEDELVRKLILDIDKLEREIRLQRQSFGEIERQLSEKEKLIRHTPSIRPLEGGRMTSPFGRRRDPFTRQWRQHNGLDFSQERGTPVFATADGVVVYVKRMHGLGKVIVIDHGYGFMTNYGHLSMFSVAKGTRVTRGQKIGEVGNTGRSTGPHLHYEVHVDGQPVNPIDYFFEGYANLTKLK